MSVYTMVFCIVAVVMVTSIIQKWLKVRELSVRNNADASQDVSGEIQAQIEALEERVKVLERIATDKSSRLKEEIDAL